MLVREVYIEMLEYWNMVAEHAADIETKENAKLGVKEIVYRILKEIEDD